MVDTTSLNYFAEKNIYIPNLMNQDLIQKNKEKPMCFVIMFGLPGSGKSTFCGRLQQKMNELFINCGSVSRDFFRYDEDGNYVFDVEREPAVQSAQLEMLYQLSMERNYDVVIIDDANISFDQIVAELLAIDHEKNSVELITFEPLPPYIQHDRTKKNGHKMPLERLIQMKTDFYETIRKLGCLNLRGITIHAPYSCDIHEDYDKLCDEEMNKAMDELIDRINRRSERRYHLFEYYVGVEPEFKRIIFEQYKQKACVAHKYGTPTKKRAKVEEEISEDEDDPIEDFDDTQPAINN